MRIAEQTGYLLLAALLSTGGAFAQTRPAEGPEASELVPSETAAPEGGEQQPAQPADEQQPDQPSEQEPAEAPQQQPERSFFQKYFLWIMIGGLILMWVIMGRSRRKQEARRKEMLAGLKKGDKVTSIGGIVGTVIEVREDEVTMKVDETNNVRMKFARWAIRGVGAESKTEGPDQKK